MPPIKKINSFSNPLIKRIRRLKRRPGESKSDFLILGGKEVQRALRARIVLTAVAFCRELFSDEDQYFFEEVLSSAKKASFYEMTRPVAEKISFGDRCVPWAALALRPSFDWESLVLTPPGRVLILDALEKPGNVGALLRTARAAGVHAVILTRSRVDPYNANVIRSSLGHCFALPYGEAEPESVVAFCRKNDLCLMALDPAGDVSYLQADLQKPFALVVGAEHEGLGSWLTREQCVRVKIPMAPEVDSLNVSVSAGIVLYEALRQRERV